MIYLNRYTIGQCLVILLSILAVSSQNLFALGEANFVETNSAPDSFVLCDGTAATIIVDTNDWSGVVRASSDLAADVNRVTGQPPTIFNELKSAGKNAIIAGTIGKSKFIDQLIREKKIDASEITGKWESFFLQVVPRPFPGIDHALVICGSDKRGTIYGIYDLSEQIGVSPWYFWADVPPKHHDRLFVKAGKYVQVPPSVKYRGIFLNDEAPALSGWVREKYGTVAGRHGIANYGHEFYTNVFELMLRLRANYLWPAMWGNAFNEDDPENPRLADEYGIVMGTSHQEPMLRAQQEWDRSYGKNYGAWNYNNTNQRPVLEQFWRDGVRRNKDYESIFTLGLRAENDSGAELGKDLTEQVMGVQRQILAGEINPDLTKVPQLWCLYKEVMGYYNEGLRVPDDVTLLWADDNWGDVRRLPTAEERQRGGGAGIYYHFDYHGGPRSYQWINTSPIAKIWDQMSLAKTYGADQIWIVNVGHFNKTSEFPLEFFMNLAWNTSRWTNENLDEFTRLWAAREFGATHADEIAQLITTYTKFNGRRKPELLDANTYSLLNYREFETVAADYAALAEQAQKIYDQLPPEYRDAFFGMVQYPIKAAAGLNAMYLAAAKNSLYSKQGRASANDFADQTRALFAAQTNLADYFNHVFAGGKWNHFMDQSYIGYRTWDPPRANNLNAVRLVENPVPSAAAMGVAVEGESQAAGGSLDFDKFGQASRYVDVFNQGQTPFKFVATPSAPWIILGESRGTIAKDARIDVSVDWSKVPPGAGSAQIKFSGANTNFIVGISTFNPAEPTPATLQGFVEADGYVSIEAEHFTKITNTDSNRWIKIPDYGQTLSGMRADGPAETLATPGKDSPCLEYKMYLFNPGNVEVETIVGPTLNFMPGRSLRYAVSFDDETPRIVTIVPADFDAHNGNRDWEKSVENNCRHIFSTHTITKAGDHTLKIWMVDPAVVLEKIVINTGGVKPSYLGPPESFHH
jgi:hypothetical protein